MNPPTTNRAPKGSFAVVVGIEGLTKAEAKDAAARCRYELDRLEHRYGLPMKIQVVRGRAIPETWNKTEAAEHLGIAHQNLDKVAGLPEPARPEKRSRLWFADEIRKFATARKRRQR